MSSPLQRLREALSTRYRLEGELGAGGMATVYRARDLKHDRTVAIKVLSPELAAALGPERFLAEIRTTARLQHPNILPLFDSGTAGPFLFYVMPCVEGESLEERLGRERQLPVDESVAIVRRLADALDHAHRQGVVHRDIKPSNVLLHEGRPLLADFGIALALEAVEGGRLTRTGVAVGTPRYMSPEQAADDPSMGPGSDIYSLACVLHEMLLGVPPHDGPTPRAILTKKLTETVDSFTTRRPTIPPNVDASVRKALEKVPADRFPTAEDFRDAISDPDFRYDLAHAQGEGVGASGESRRSRWVIGGALLTVAVATVAFAFLGVPDARETVDAAAGVVEDETVTVIAVLPFRTSGPGLEHMGEGLMDLLSHSLPQSNTVATVDPRTIVKRFGDFAPRGQVDVGDATSLARDVGATGVLLGSAVSAGTDLRLDAVVYGLDGAPLAAARVGGPTEEPFALADELAVSVVRELWTSGAPLPHLNPGAVTTRSPEAVRDWLAGERMYRAGDITGAREVLERAASQDSTFALARYRLGWTLAWTEGPEAPETVAELRGALRHGDRLPRRERTVLEAFLMFSERRLEEGHRILTPHLRRWPDDPEAWIVMANLQYHHPEWMRSWNPSTG
ncbi:MAG: protein kinase [Longimicrobiales bacterium]|nr:protein kinase [Longimicrobiales bacterium]